jgi:hypothetical protein
MRLSAFSFINRLLGHPLASVIIIAIAWLNKLFISISFYSLSDDKALYSVLALNATEGHGFKEPFYFIQDPGTVYFFSHTAIYSPGYPFLLAPLLVITGKNIYLSTIIIEGLSWLLFFYATRAILKFCSASLSRINIATLLLGFFIYSHEIQSAAKDTLSVSLLLIACIYILRRIKNISSPVKTGIFAATLVLVPGFFKFIYLPLFFPLLLMFLIAGYIKKDKKLISTFLWSILFAGFLLATWYIWIFLISQGTSYPFNFKDWSMTKEGAEFIRGFYPENLINTFPFIVSAFCNMEFWATQAERLLPGSYSVADIFFRLLNLVLLIGLFIQFVLFSFKTDRTKVTNAHLFIISGFLLSIFLLSLIFLMSVLHKAIHYKGGTIWTYVSEARSWLFIIVFLQILVFILLHQKFSQHNLLFKRILQLAFFLIVFESFHGFYFSLKTALQFKNHRKEISANANSAILSDLKDIRKNYPDKKVELVAESRPLRLVAYLNGNKVYCNTPTLAASPDLIPPNTVLLIVIHEDDLPIIKNYTSSQDVRFFGKKGGYYLFIQEKK